MENSLKRLKWESIGILVFTVANFVEFISSFIFASGDSGSDLSKSTLIIVNVISIIFAVAILAVKCYVGIKGLLIAKNPDSSRLHIILAKIIFVVSVITFAISGILALFSDSASDAVSSLLLSAVEVAIYFDYIKYAKEASKNC
jgi:uncharacterized membrane protein YwaF